MKDTSSITKRTGNKGATYQVRIRQIGIPTLTRSFDTLAEAQAWRDETRTKLNKGEQVITKQHRSITIPEAIDDYLAHAGAWIKSERERQRLEKLKAEFAGLAVVQLTAAKLNAWKNELLNTQIPARANKTKTHKLYNGDTAKNYSESSVRKYFYALKKSLEWFYIFRDVPFNNPFSIVKAPAEDNNRTRRLEEGEEERLIQACDKMYVNQEALKRVIRLALETAMRSQELLKMKWSDINFAQCRILIPAANTKSKAERQVALTSVAIEILKAHRDTKKIDEPRVFWQWKNSDVLGHKIKIITKNAALDDFRFHDLRHEATSRFYENSKLTDIEIASITGHKEFKTLKRYANLRSNNLAAKLW